MAYTGFQLFRFLFRQLSLHLHYFILYILFNCKFCLSALILEEIAIDSHDKEDEDRYLQEAQDLHLQSLALAKKAFGENNVQTAKHYGNLGRLYQSMRRYIVSCHLSPSF